MEILTYINFLGTSEAAQTGDSINLALILLICLLLVIAGSLCFVFRSKRFSSAIKKIIGIGLPSIFLVLAVPMIVAGQSWAAGSSTSVNAIVDTDNGLAYIENGNIQNTTEDDMQLIVTNSDAKNAGLNIPGLQNANLKVYIGGNLVLDDNPFDGYEGNIDSEYVLKPGQSVQFSSELTGLDKQTAEALEGSGNSIQLRFKFYYSMVETYYGPDDEAPVADYLYEAVYSNWDVDKTNFLCECMAKTAAMYPADSDEYKNYLRREWGCDEDEVNFIVALRKYLEDDNPYTNLCTSCRLNNYIGRNFDWAYDDLDEYVIRTTASTEQNRYKSIGVASTFFPKTLQTLVDIKTVLPMLTMDGVNEKGVAININVVPSDLQHTIGTNPGAKRLCAGVVPRFVLDNASTASEAIDLLMERDIFTIFLSEFHFMISDASETYIVEMSQNKLVVLQHTNNQKTAMSNFHVSNSLHQQEYNVVVGEPGTYMPNYTDHPMGIERYDLAIDGLQNVSCLDSSDPNTYSMVKHMERIYYKHVNLDWNIDGGGKKFWSDKNGQPSVWDEDHIFSFYDSDEWDGDRIATFAHNQENYNQVHAREDQIGQRVTSNELANGVCQTVHASCYDIINKELVVNVQERDVSFHFSLNGGFREGGKATGIFVNGDNVGLATECNAPDSKWTYDTASKTLTLQVNEENKLYSITGTDVDVTILSSGLDGYSVTIPKIEHAQTFVQVIGGDYTPKARKGVRAVPKNSHVKVTFTADEGYEFFESQEKPEKNKYIVDIASITNSIIFDTTEGYDLPTVILASNRYSNGNC